MCERCDEFEKQYGIAKNERIRFWAHVTAAVVVGVTWGVAWLLDATMHYWVAAVQLIFMAGLSILTGFQAYRKVRRLVDDAKAAVAEHRRNSDTLRQPEPQNWV